MAFYFTFSDSRGQPVATIWLGHLDRSYRLVPGAMCPLHDQAAWCETCRAIVPAEDLPSLEKIDAERQQLRHNHEEFLRNAFNEGHIQPWMIANTRQTFARAIKVNEWHRRWRERRQSPARCLQCSSVEIRCLESQSKFVHPETGLIVELTGAFHASMAIHEYYSSEGMRLK